MRLLQHERAAVILILSLLFLAGIVLLLGWSAWFIGYLFSSVIISIFPLMEPFTEYVHYGVSIPIIIFFAYDLSKSQRKANIEVEEEGEWKPNTKIGERMKKWMESGYIIADEEDEEDVED